MLNVIRIVVLAALVWTGYWFAAGYGIRSSIAGWFDRQAGQGWQADYADMSTSGFPMQHETAITSPALADPVNGTAWQADWLKLVSPAIWPGRQTLRFAPTPQRLSYLDQTLVVEAAAMQADLHLHPGVALALSRMALTAGPWSITRDNATLTEAADLTLEMVQTDQPETYQISFSAMDFTPGDGLRGGLGQSAALPRSFETLQFDLRATFDKSWDRTALEQRRPQPTMLDLALAEAKWGELRLFATGEVQIDEAGLPTGEIALKAENWREMLTMAQEIGALPERAVNPVTRVLNMLAGLGGNPNALDVQLNFRDGYVALGPIPLGPAPRLILR